MIFSVKRTNSKFLQSFQILSKQDQFKLLAVTAVQAFLGLLDLLGIIVVGMLGALSVSGLQSKPPGNRVNQVLNFTGLDSHTFQNQILILSVIAVALLLTRTFLSIFF